MSIKCIWCEKEVEKDSLFTRNCKKCSGQDKLEEKYFKLGKSESLDEFINKLKRRFNTPSISEVIDKVVEEENKNE